MHWIFVDYMKHVPTAKYFLDEFFGKYSRDFKITGGHHLVESFIGLDVEQSKSKISLHLDMYIRYKWGSPSRFINQPRSLRQRLWPHHEGAARQGSN